METRKPLFLILVNLALASVFLFICLTPFFINRPISWFVSMVGMGFPYLAAAIILLLIIWIFRLGKPVSKWMVILNLVLLILGAQQIKSVFGFNFFSKNEVMIRPEGIRVMSWNVSSWDIRNWDAKNHNTFQPVMYDLIEQVNPDVLLLQEFFNCIDPSIVPSYVNLLVERGYPYYYFSPHSFTVSGKFQSGLGIFSRYPITDTLFVFPESGGHSEGFQRANIEINGKQYSFFNTHLESAGLDADDVASIGKVKGSRSIFYKIKYAHRVRMVQATALKEEMKQSPHPVILGGDIGELPNSTTYFFVKKGLKDAFTKKGSGLGRTFALIAPNLRIDYLFVSPELKVKTFFKINKEYSVHYPIISDISE